MFERDPTPAELAANVRAGKRVADVIEYKHGGGMAPDAF